MNYYKVKFMHHKNGQHVEDFVFLTLEERPTEGYARKLISGFSWTGDPVLVLNVKPTTKVEVDSHFAAKFRHGLDALDREIEQARYNHLYQLARPKQQPTLETQLAAERLKTLLEIQTLFNA